MKISYSKFTADHFCSLSKLKVGQNVKHSFHRQVERDCEFLEQERIMDYSLLVGLHFRDTEGKISGFELHILSSFSALVFLLLT